MVKKVSLQVGSLRVSPGPEFHSLAPSLSPLPGFLGPKNSVAFTGHDHLCLWVKKVGTRNLGPRPAQYQNWVFHTWRKLWHSLLGTGVSHLRERPSRLLGCKVIDFLSSLRCKDKTSGFKRN